MPIFRRKTAPAPAPAPLPEPQPNQHWVAYMYAPQPVPMPSMYALQTPGPYLHHPTFHGLQYRTVVPGVQYMYQQQSSTYSDSPQHSTNTLPQHVRSTVETEYHQHARKLHRSYSGGQPFPIARGADADRYYTDDEYAVQIQTQPAKQSVLTTLINIARGRSKSRGRTEAVPTSRPRSRGGFTDDGHERGRAKDPRYVDTNRQRRLSTENKAKHESQQSFDKSIMDEKGPREDPVHQKEDRRASVHRSSTKEDLRRKYEAEDRLRQQQEEYQRTQPVQIPNTRPSPRNRAASPDGLSESPTLIEHTKWNARQSFHRPDSGYRTDTPAKPSRRSSAQMQRLDLASPIEKSASAPEGFFNRRGDQLMNSKGDVLRRPPHLEYPPEFSSYPPPGTGWMDHKGQLVGPDLRWIRKVG